MQGFGWFITGAREASTMPWRRLEGVSHEQLYLFQLLLKKFFRRPPLTLLELV